MKKNLIYLLFTMFFLSSCGTIVGIKKPIGLIGKPDDLIIRNQETGEVLEIKQGRIASEGGNHTTTIYIGDMIKLKPRKVITLEFEVDGVKKTFDVTRRNNVGALILEGFFTLGIAAIIDIITGGNKTHKPELIDVPAIFENREQRSKNELMKYLRSNSH